MDHQVVPDHEWSMFEVENDSAKPSGQGELIVDSSNYVSPQTPQSKQHPKVIVVDSQNASNTQSHPGGTDKRAQPSLSMPDTTDTDADRNAGDPMIPIDPLDWSELQERYAAAMDERYTAEVQIREEFVQLMKFFSVWSQVPSNGEHERASKRLKTRMAWVQTAESNLDQKKEHCKYDGANRRPVLTLSADVKVVKAFESALSLLSGT